MLHNINYAPEKDTGSVWGSLTSLPFRINYKVPSDCRCDLTRSFKFMSAFLDSLKNAKKLEQNRTQH